MLFSCYKKEIDEFANLPLSEDVVTDPLSFLDQNNTNPNIESNKESKNIITNTNYFDVVYTDIEQWGTVQFSQQDTDLHKESPSDFLLFLVRSRSARKQNTILPVDTQIGPLQDNTRNNYVDVLIIKIINNFFDTMKKGTLDKELTKMVLQSELPVISRQIARTAEFSDEISDIRIGTIQIDGPSSRNVSTRVFREGESIHSRAKFLFYFVQRKSEWFINAIEGDFEYLNLPYKHPGKFVPLGTTGITQGF